METQTHTTVTRLNRSHPSQLPRRISEVRKTSILHLVHVSREVGNRLVSHDGLPRVSTNTNGLFRVLLRGKGCIPSHSQVWAEKGC